MELVPGTPIDDIFRGAVSKEQVTENIHRLLDRAEKLTFSFGVPGYSEQTINDFQKIICFFNEMDIPLEIKKIKESYKVSEELAQNVVYDALKNGWSNLCPSIIVKTNLNRTKLIVERQKNIAV